MSAKKTARKKKPISVPAKVTRKRAAKRTTRRAQGRSAPFADFMVQAYVMESEARDRYTEFADQMEVHNNVAVAQLFRRLSRIEGLHAQKIMKEMGWRTPPAPTLGWIWGHADAPESVPVTELHYLMQPYHALELALQCEQRAASFFSGIARSIAPGDVKRIAIEMAKEERQHVRLIKDWLKKVEKPAPGWDRDPDPPYLSE